MGELRVAVDRAAAEPIPSSGGRGVVQAVEMLRRLCSGGGDVPWGWLSQSTWLHGEPGDLPARRAVE